MIPCSTTPFVIRFSRSYVRKFPYEKEIIENFKLSNDQIKSFSENLKEIKMEKSQLVSKSFKIREAIDELQTIVKTIDSDISDTEADIQVLERMLKKSKRFTYD